MTRNTISRITSTISTLGYISETSTFLRTAERQFLVGDEALQHFDQAAGFLARHDGGHVDFRENALLPEGFGQQRALAHIFADAH